jgi:hypothetical protein
MIEKISGGHPASQPETRPIGNRAVGDHEQPAFVAPNGFVARQRRRVAHHQESGRAASRVKQAHQEFLATSGNLYFSLAAKLPRPFTKPVMPNPRFVPPISTAPITPFPFEAPNLARLSS